jgi:hypothetical protein
MPTPTASPQSKVFIGSSREASQLAKALQHELRDVAHSQVWSQGLFRIGSVALEELVRVVNGFDFGIFVFAPDDVVKMRDKEYSAVRDNVLFELGMFVGKLGAHRSFFVVPQANDNLHLPSDLAGIAPAKYDANERNLQVAVAPATFEIATRIAELGPLQGGKNILFDTRKDGRSKVFRGKESYVYKKKERVGERAQGSLSIGNEGLLTINRSNNAGRYEIHLRPEGPEQPSFSKGADPPPPRSLHISCDIRATNATRKVRFVAKDEENEKWLASETRRVDPGDWSTIDFYLWVDATQDFLFRIDDEEVSEAPSTLSIRNLKIVEEE